MESVEASPSQSRPTSAQIDVPEKVVLRFKATGNAPQMKQTKFKISSSNKFQAVIDFLKKQLNLDTSEGKENSGVSLFLYVNSCFTPTPDELVANLYRCFSSDGMLLINYSLQEVYG